MTLKEFTRLLKTHHGKNSVIIIDEYDTANESFYHGLVLDMVGMFNIYYEISSNREAGKGWYDIMFRPRDKERPAYIIELKALKRAGAKDDMEEMLYKNRRIKSFLRYDNRVFLNLRKNA